MFKRVCKAAGIGDGWTPRELRASFVSLLSHRGISIEEIAHLVRHTSTRSTEIVYRRELRPVIMTGAEIMDEVFGLGAGLHASSDVRLPAAEPGYDEVTELKEPKTMTRAVHVPYTVEQDEDGVWCAHAQLRPGVGANGEGDSREAAVADLREALEGLIAEFGPPQELTLTVDVA